MNDKSSEYSGKEHRTGSSTPSSSHLNNHEASERMDPTYNEEQTHRNGSEHDVAPAATTVVKKQKKPRKKRKATSEPPSLNRVSMATSTAQATTDDQLNVISASEEIVAQAPTSNLSSQRKREKTLKKGKKKKEGKKEKKELQNSDKEEVRFPLSKKLKRIKGSAAASSSGQNNISSSTVDPFNNNQTNYTAAQSAVNDMMRRALEEDQYSALGSIVDTESSDSEDDDTNVIWTIGQANKVTAVKLDRSVLQNALKRKLRGAVASSTTNMDMLDFPKKKKKKKKNHYTSTADTATPVQHDEMDEYDDMMEEDTNNEPEEGSIFDQPGTTNSTWVECDKCKKWRRLRGVVDTKKLPSKWYCAMNKNDPERARCTAPEEDYDVPSTPESATDHRARKHLRLWVRRLQCNEAFEARLPNTMTTRSSKGKVQQQHHQVPHQMLQPYDWVRCCNPSCGKWRALLRYMDKEQWCGEKEWYCVMNTWDEKTASCAAPQEALPALGCPTWVMKDEDLK